MVSINQELFLELVRLGIDASYPLPNKDFAHADWTIIEAIAEEHGLSGIVLDGLDRIPLGQRPEKKDLLQLIGIVLQAEEHYAIQWKTACEMSLLFHNNAIRTYVLKGYVISECYPNPMHRNSADMDCFLIPESGTFDAWDLGNSLVKTLGVEISTSFYKNSTFYFPGLIVENHKFMVPFRGNKRLQMLEVMLQSYMNDDAGNDVIEGTGLFRPPLMVSSLFFIEHAYSHFLHEGLTWRHVLDWVLFRKKHLNKIDWYSLDALIDEFGFRRFYDTYNRIGQYLMGEIKVDSLTKADKKMLDDIWAPLDLHKTTEGWKGKVALAGNTWRARWKYHYFSDISMLHALWIQVIGVLFIKEPNLY